MWEDVEVTAVEIDESIAKIYQDFFPEDKVIVGDAHQYLLDHFEEFDFIWSSPPCPTHSKMRLLNVYSGNTNPVYPDMKLYQEILFLEKWFQGKYSIENVVPYYEPLIRGRQSGRHLFWTNFNIGTIDTHHLSIKNTTNVSIDDRMSEHDFIIQDWHGYKGDKRTIFKNCVHPEQGLYILNCARNIITKSTVQTSLEFKHP